MNRDKAGLAVIRKALTMHKPCQHITRNYRKGGIASRNELSPLFNETYYIGIQKDACVEFEACK